MSSAANHARTCASLTTPAAIGTAQSARPPLPRNGWPTAKLNSCPCLISMSSLHCRFTLPAPIADIAYQNKAVVYDLLLKVAAETLITIAADPKCVFR